MYKINGYFTYFYPTDKNVRVLEQQILQLQSQLQQQLNMTTIQQPLMAGMQMSNMASPMVSTVNPNQGFFFFFLIFFNFYFHNGYLEKALKVSLPDRQSRRVKNF